MNKVVLVGRLTSDPDLRFISSSGKAVTRITLAVDRSFKKEGQPNADFIQCVCYGPKAEAIANYFSKGKLIAIAGRIETGSYMKGEQKVYTTTVVIEDFQFIESKQQSEPKTEVEFNTDMTPVDDGDNISF